MPSLRNIMTALAVGALGGALCAIWFTIAEAQGLTSTPRSPQLHRVTPAER
jgi:hypothetical protein